MRGRKKQVKTFFFFSALKNNGSLKIYICSLSSSSPYTQQNGILKYCFWIAVQTNSSVFEYKVLRLLVIPFCGMVYSNLQSQILSMSGPWYQSHKTTINTFNSERAWQMKKEKVNKFSFLCHQ